MYGLSAYVVDAALFEHSISPAVHLRFAVLADNVEDAVSLVQEQLSKTLIAKATGVTLSDDEAEAIGLEPYRPRLLPKA